ncbi:hypothetical protein BDD21_1250 [Thiocapsa rosea]|uniref:Uncharacterized protein n=1 Tax=Thiocapsa rosea TaxID=69360 RepID=A0A495V3A4_9GAMM|nr:hypothetical protein BDD21_1250 [Thiocapsa rosea]
MGFAELYPSYGFGFFELFFILLDRVGEDRADA